MLRSSMFMAIAAPLAMALGIPGVGSAAQTVKIGNIIPLSGPSAPVGVQGKNAREMAVQEINAAGGIKGRPIKLIVEDSEYRPQAGLDAATKLFDVDKVDAAILAQLLRADLLPEAWIAPPAVRQLRALRRHPAQLVRLRTPLRHRVHARGGQWRVPAAGHFPMPWIAFDSCCQKDVPPTAYPIKGKNRAALLRLKRRRMEESIGQVGACSIRLHSSASSAIKSLIC